MSGEGSRLSRWSRRKAAARRGETPPEQAEEIQPPPDAADADEADAVTPDAIADDVAAAEDMPDLPPVDELTFESDYTAFLNTKVPEVLRRAALRKLWTSDPVLANLDGLNDYDEDYHLVDTTITAAQTAYRAGRGYFDAVEEKLEQVDRALGPDAAAESDAGSAGAAIPAQLGPVSENDAAGDNGLDAPQQVSAVEPADEPARPTQDRGE